MALLHSVVHVMWRTTRSVGAEWITGRVSDRSTLGGLPCCSYASQKVYVAAPTEDIDSCKHAEVAGRALSACIPQATSVDMQGITNDRGEWHV